LDEDGKPLANRSLVLLAIWNEREELIGVAPWYRQTTRGGTQIVRFLGDGEVCSEYPSVLCRAVHEADVALTLAEWLTAANEASRGTPADSWDRLELTPVDPGDSAVAMLLERLDQFDNRVYRDEAASCWRLSLPGTWEEFLAKLPKRARNRMRHADRTWVQSGQVKLHMAPRDCDADTALAILVDLHQRRWQSRGLPGCFASRAFSGFHREVWKRFSADGRAVIYWLELDGKPLAADYALVGSDTVYGYLMGIDPDRLETQPGQLMNMMVLQRAVEDGSAVYDFLRGDEPYKSHLRAEPRAMLAARVVPRRARAQLRYAAWNAGRQMRGLAKRGWQVAREWRQGKHQTQNVKS
jgi:hypothetical protein